MTNITSTVKTVETEQMQELLTGNQHKQGRVNVCSRRCRFFVHAGSICRNDAYAILQSRFSQPLTADAEACMQALTVAWAGCSKYCICLTPGPSDVQRLWCRRGLQSCCQACASLGIVVDRTATNATALTPVTAFASASSWVGSSRACEQRTATLQQRSADTVLGVVHLVFPAHAERALVCRARCISDQKTKSRDWRPSRQGPRRDARFRKTRDQRAVCSETHSRMQEINRCIVVVPDSYCLRGILFLASGPGVTWDQIPSIFDLDHSTALQAVTPLHSTATCRLYRPPHIAPATQSRPFSHSGRVQSHTLPADDSTNATLFRKRKRRRAPWTVFCSPLRALAKRRK